MSQGRARVPSDSVEGPRLRPGADQLDTTIEIATWFYVHGWSQIEISRALGLDPSTVSRYLKRARQSSIVKVEIRRPSHPALELARAVAAHLGLPRVVVAPAVDPVIETVAATAAQHLDGFLRAGLRLGTSWGHTLAAVVGHLQPGSVGGMSIAQLAGGLDESTPGIQGHELVRALGGAFPGSRTRYLHAPAIVDGVKIAEALLRDTSIAAAIPAAAASEVALVGIGSMDEHATLVRGGHVSEADRQALLEMGAVGNMNTRFFDGDGRSVGEIDRRTIAVTWEDLRAIPTVIAVAAGESKAEAIRGAALTGCIDALVTDERVARILLDSPGIEPGPG